MVGAHPLTSDPPVQFPVKATRRRPWRSNWFPGRRTERGGRQDSRRRFTMVPRLARFVVALTVAITGAQVGAQTPQPAPDPQAPPAISLPPAFDRVLRDYEAAWRDGDGPRMAALFTEDGFAVQSGSPIRRGRSAIAGGITKPGGTLQL